ncbi:DMT family transporter [Streptomyces sp. TLI_171]|uniref:DMT family transporter n=1 Tax=Streptomyces sp. TLI_171 TaxID=1938859 RepID=UPI000C3E0CA6|nr:EamA family transporter [Streptomyces sp. TLI_171]RKE17407.1 putative blue pigment (indigoidine) exporter [Streptomyces sp. TLI_171]
MENNLRWSALTALAPVAWGANYWVTHRYLPPGAPLWGAALRALPAGLLLLAAARRLPRGVWWWRSAALGVLNTAAFFVLVYLASQWLPAGTAAMVMALSPLALMLCGWLLLAERPRAAQLLGGAVGIGGVVLMLAGGAGAAGPAGVLASLGALLASSVGYALARRWSADGPGVLASTAWQLTFGGLLLLPAAALFEGPPPALDGGALFAFGYTSLVATALAFLVWFAGLRRLPAAGVGLIGLLNPLTGVLLGTVLDGEPLDAARLWGIALVPAGIALGGARSVPGSTHRRTGSERTRPVVNSRS